MSCSLIQAAGGWVTKYSSSFSLKSRMETITPFYKLSSKWSVAREKSGTIYCAERFVFKKEKIKKNEKILIIFLYLISRPSQTFLLGAVSPLWLDRKVWIALMYRFDFLQDSFELCRRSNASKYSPMGFATKGL